MQSSLFRRRLGVRAAFEVLRRRRIAFKHKSSFDSVGSGVPIRQLRYVVEKSTIKNPYRPAILKVSSHEYFHSKIKTF